MITLTCFILLILGIVFFARKASKGRGQTKARRGATRNTNGKGGLDSRAIIGSIESYLVQTHGMTSQPEDEGQFSCYRDLDDNVQLFVTWNHATYLQGVDLPRDSRTVVAKTDAVSMIVCLVTTRGTVWQKKLQWGAVDRASWNGKPKGLYSKPIDSAIREALTKYKKAQR